MFKAIKVDDLSKAYQLGEIGTGTLSRDLERWFAKIRGKKDPFLAITENNDRTTSGKTDFVWSLKDVSFEIEQGDAVGIIGRNGAGKSTLLKVLSRITSPTCGTIKIKGRIASLLEVGTGFHPELTGRENIFLNGAILGMRRKEISRKFDEIVDFAGVERYIDTPVKRYSSGMYVRLAFAVAAHLESEILIVDEVLSVGDSEFQKKCLGKMNEVSHSEGRTVLFVSHDMHAIARLVNKCVWLNNGMLQSIGGKEIISDYISSTLTSLSLNYLNNKHLPGSPAIKSVILKASSPGNIHICGNRFEVELIYVLPFPIKKTCITIRIKDNRNINCLDFSFFDDEKNASAAGEYKVTWSFLSLSLYMGAYTCDIFFAEPPGGKVFEHLPDACSFTVTMLDQSRGEWEWKPYDTIYLESYAVEASRNS